MSRNQLSEREIALLLDLGRLLKKHGSESFRELAESLSDSDWTARLSMILEAVAVATPERPSTRPSNRGRPLLERAEAVLRASDPGRAEVVEPVARQLVTGEVLPRLADVIEFASSVGMPALRAKSRGEAVIEMLRWMVASSDEDVAKLVTDLQASAGRGSRSLEGWSRIIERSRAATNTPKDR